MSRLEFPAGFLWGAASSAHQTEGSNVASDHWQLETRAQPPQRVVQISGDACDSYHRFAEDMGIVADSGLNSYRFSIEWARIEPAEGHFMRGQLEHYRTMIDTCRSLGLEPVVTLNHATVPAWLGREGSWDSPRAASLFARYVRTLLPILRDVTWICTINEPNMSAINDGGLAADYPGGLPPAKEPYATHLFEAHRLARDELKSSRADLMVGWTVGCQGFQIAPGAEAMAERYCWSREWRYLEGACGDDFIGVQNYSRVTIGPAGPLPAEPGARVNQLGWQLWPRSLAECVETAYRLARVPVLVTEHGLPSLDDSQRIAFTGESLVELHHTIALGVPVLGYLHWTLLDNYEWGSFEPRFGLVEVDFETFERRPKPSLAWLGRVAESNGLTADGATGP